MVQVVEKIVDDLYRKMWVLLKLRGYDLIAIRNRQWSLKHKLRTLRRIRLVLMITIDDAHKQADQEVIEDIGSRVVDRIIV